MALVMVFIFIPTGISSGIRYPHLGQYSCEWVQVYAQFHHRIAQTCLERFAAFGSWGNS